MAPRNTTITYKYIQQSIKCAAVVVAPRKSTRTQNFWRNMTTRWIWMYVLCVYYCCIASYEVLKTKDCCWRWNTSYTTLLLIVAPEEIEFLTHHEWWIHTSSQAARELQFYQFAGGEKKISRVILKNKAGVQNLYRSSGHRGRDTNNFRE